MLFFFLFPACLMFLSLGVRKRRRTLAGHSLRLIQIRLTVSSLKKNHLGLSTQFVASTNRDKVVVATALCRRVNCASTEPPPRRLFLQPSRYWTIYAIYDGQINSIRSVLFVVATASCRRANGASTELGGQEKNRKNILPCQRELLQTA